MAARRITELDRRERKRVVTHAVLRSVAITAVLITAYYLAPVREVTKGGAVLRIAIGLVAFVIILGLQLRSIMSADLPQLRMMEALGTAVPVFLVIFAISYLALSHADPKSFTEPLNHTSALYFVVVTVGTVGFGDIAPKSDVARIIVMFQILLDIILLGTLVRLMVTAVEHRLGHDEESDEESDDESVDADGRLSLNE